VRGHFTGKERDAESGLDYFGARYYSSSMGRFSSPDPLGYILQIRPIRKVLIFTATHATALS
jgi:RHS repeat-associated protein